MARNYESYTALFFHNRLIVFICEINILNILYFCLGILRDYTVLSSEIVNFNLTSLQKNWFLEGLKKWTGNAYYKNCKYILSGS